MTRTVKLEVKELKFAVKNKTHVTARSLQAMGKINYEASAHMQASDDLENSYELMRGISDAIAETKVELGEYLNENVTTTTNRINTAVENNEAVDLVFELPTNFNGAAFDSLGAGIHDFVVGRAIYAWYRQTAPEIAEACRVDADAALQKAKMALYKRSRPERPTYSS